MKKVVLCIAISGLLVAAFANNISSMPAPNQGKTAPVHTVPGPPKVVSAAPKVVAKKRLTGKELMRETFGQLPSDVLKEIPQFAVNP